MDAIEDDTVPCKDDQSTVAALFCSTLPEMHIMLAGMTRRWVVPQQ